ncbi:MAG: hypothetical protein AUG51_05415 [Acidobacteria bacterium 13_1_20CM_3_53_8]|nr:MAG: hypothetical protein AUG51_05415 [Acidobacteria bacterium 13_1_20CM_3_53_8]
MKAGKHVLILLLTICAFGSTLAQQSVTQSATEPDRAKFEELRTRGFEALYNLDYDEAQKNFQELERIYPTHPAGAQFLAAALWSKILNKSRRLQASLYNSDSFYSNNEDQVDPNDLSQFRELTRRAATLAKARLRANPRDVEALYFLGATEGLKAAFEGAVQRSFISALRDGSSSVDRHRDVLKLDPDFHDAELTIGLYDYVVGNLPLPVKLLASIGGFHGSKKRGLATLERVAREGKFVRDDAKIVLIALYKREKRFNDSLAISRELGTKYPRNYLFKLETADALVSQASLDRAANKPADAAGEEREAFGTFDVLLHDRAAARYQDLIHFKYGEALMTAQQFDRAAREFLAVTTSAGAEANLVTMAHLRAGQALDLAGKRNDALTQYRAVLARPNVYDSQTEARDGLRAPYKPKKQAGDTDEE